MAMPRQSSDHVEEQKKETKDISTTKLTELEQFDQIIKEMQTTATWSEEFKKIKTKLKDANFSEETWKKKIDDLLQKYLTEAVLANNAADLADGTWGTLKRHIITDEAHTKVAIKTIETLGQLGHNMPSDLRFKVIGFFLVSVEECKLKNPEILCEINRAYTAFGDAIPESLRMKVVMRLFEMFGQCKGDLEFATKAIVPFWDLEFMKIVPKECKPLLTALVDNMARKDYFTFMSVAPILTNFYKLPQFLTADEKAKYKTMIAELPYKGAYDYDDLAKLWAKPESPKASLATSATLFNSISASVEEKLGAVEKKSTQTTEQVDTQQSKRL